MYEVPKDDEIGAVRITRAYIEHKGGPVITLRQSQPRLPRVEESAGCSQS